MGKLKILFIKNRCEKIARQKKRRKNKKRRIHYLFENNTYKLKKSQIIFDNYNFYKKNINVENNISTVNIPTDFSLIDNPEESIATLKEINYIFSKSNINNIQMNYSNCNRLGLEASVLTDLIVLNGLNFRKKINSPIRLSGTVPSSYTAGEIFWNSGLLKHLSLSKIEDPLVERLDPFTLTMNDSNYATNETLTYFNNCLNRTGFSLNYDGISYFTKLIGEIIGNAKEHNGSNGEWYVSGHFTQATPGNYGKGSLSFISIGNTIYENLMNNCKSEETKNKINNHLKLHKGLFNLGWTEESSVTVFGLQYKISSETDEQHRDRGTGTIKFIDSFSKLGKTFNDEKPKMTIISGNTHILFDGTYNLKKVSNGKNTLEIISFNKENDLGKKPDPNYVKVLKNGFPGVIISIEFYLDKAYLLKIKEENK